jgi:hypothetical protein
MQEKKGKLKGKLWKEPGLDELGNSYYDADGKREIAFESVG